MTPDTPVILRSQRERLGLSQYDVARQCGLSGDEYFDLELHEDEAWAVVSVQHLKRVCATLGLDLLATLGLRCAFCESELGEGSGPPDRAALMRAYRVENDLTIDAVGEAFNLVDSAVREAEGDPGALDQYPPRMLFAAAKATGIPMQRLLGVQCRSCLKW